MSNLNALLPLQVAAAVAVLQTRPPNRSIDEHIDGVRISILKNRLKDLTTALATANSELNDLRTTIALQSASSSSPPQTKKGLGSKVKSQKFTKSKTSTSSSETVNGGARRQSQSDGGGRTSWQLAHLVALLPNAKESSELQISAFERLVGAAMVVVEGRDVKSKDLVFLDDLVTKAYEIVREWPCNAVTYFKARLKAVYQTSHAFHTFYLIDLPQHHVSSPPEPHPLIRLPTHLCLPALILERIQEIFKLTLSTSTDAERESAKDAILILLEFLESMEDVVVDIAEVKMLNLLWRMDLTVLGECVRRAVVDMLLKRSR